MGVVEARDSSQSMVDDVDTWVSLVVFSEASAEGCIGCICTSMSIVVCAVVLLPLGLGDMPTESVLYGMVGTVW